MNAKPSAIEVFPAEAPPGLVPHGDNIDAAYVEGNMGGLVVIKLRAGELPAHSHGEEHVGVVLVGAFTFVTEAEDVSLEAGDMYRVPANVLHGVRCEDSALVVQARS